MGATDTPQILFDRSAIRSPIDIGNIDPSARIEVLPKPGQNDAPFGLLLRRGGLQKRMRFDLTREVKRQVCHTFALMDGFRSALEPGSSSGRLARSLQVVLEAARNTCTLASKARMEEAQFMVDRSRCLRDLDLLVAALLTDRPPSQYELAHAMDALIVHMVQLTKGS